MKKLFTMVCLLGLIVTQGNTYTTYNTNEPYGYQNANYSNSSYPYGTQGYNNNTQLQQTLNTANAVSNLITGSVNSIANTIKGTNNQQSNNVSTYNGNQNLNSGYSNNQQYPYAQNVNNQYSQTAYSNNQQANPYGNQNSQNLNSGYSNNQQYPYAQNVNNQYSQTAYSNNQQVNPYGNQNSQNFNSGYSNNQQYANGQNVNNQYSQTAYPNYQQSGLYGTQSSPNLNYAYQNTTNQQVDTIPIWVAQNNTSTFINQWAPINSGISALENDSSITKNPNLLTQTQKIKKDVNTFNLLLNKYIQIYDTSARLNTVSVPKQEYNYGVLHILQSIYKPFCDLHNAISSDDPIKSATKQIGDQIYNLYQKLYSEISNNKCKIYLIVPQNYSLSTDENEMINLIKRNQPITAQ